MSAPSTERVAHRHVFVGAPAGEHGGGIYLRCLVGSCMVQQRIGPGIEVTYLDQHGCEFNPPEDAPTHAWLHWCGALNSGSWLTSEMCGGCRSSVDEPYPGEVTEFRLTPIRGGAAGQGGGQAPFVALVVTPEPNVPD